MSSATFNWLSNKQLAVAPACSARPSDCVPLDRVFKSDQLISSDRGIEAFNFRRLVMARAHEAPGEQGVGYDGAGKRSVRSLSSN